MILVHVTQEHLDADVDEDGLQGPINAALWAATGDRWWLDGARAYRLDPEFPEPAAVDGVHLPYEARNWEDWARHVDARGESFVFRFPYRM